MAAGLRSAAIALPKIVTDAPNPNNNRINDRIAIFLRVIGGSSVPAQVAAGQRLFLFRPAVNRERRRGMISGLFAPPETQRFPGGASRPTEMGNGTGFERAKSALSVGANARNRNLRVIALTM
jgi:hypothetical protein